MARHRGAGSGPPRGNATAVATASASVSIAVLREEWERLHGKAAPPALSPDFLRRDIAYRQQVKQHGDLSAGARRRLAACARTDAGQAPPSRTPTSLIKPGSALLREWRGRTYTVLALESGFELAGQRFASLSEVARHITGAHWSGPRFFGLRRAQRTSMARASNGETSDA